MGPKISFDLETAIKSPLKYAFRSEKPTLSETEDYLENLKNKKKTGTTTLPSEEPATDELERKTADEKEIKSAINEGIKNYRSSNKAISDQTFSARITPLLIQFKSSFERIQNQFDAITEFDLDDKPPCTFD